MDPVKRVETSGEKSSTGGKVVAPSCASKTEPHRAGEEPEDQKRSLNYFQKFCNIIRSLP